MCLLELGLYLAGIMSSSAQLIFTMAIMFIGLLAGMIQYRNKANGGFGSFGELYKAGLLITLVVAVITTVYFLVFLQINPSYVDKLKEYTEAKQLKQDMSPEQRQMTIKMMSASFSPVTMFIFSFLGRIFFGAVAGLIAAAITAKPRQITENKGG